MASLMTAAQVAERWACSPSHVKRLARSGQLRAVRIGNIWRFRLESVEAYEAGATSGPAAVEPAAPAARPALAVVDSLPADYSPVFPELWADRAALPAAGRGRSATTRKRA